MSKLFCRHIWKRTKRILIDEYRVMILETVPQYDVKEYALYFTCLKCGKEKIERRNSTSSIDEWKILGDE